MLRARLDKQLGAFHLDAEISVGDGSVMVLVGESGSGKTTLLRLLAGFVDPDRGRIEVDGAVWFDGAAGEARPACERAIGYVAQNYALFPHLTTAENVAYGLRASRVSRQEIEVRVAAMLERLEIEALARQRPDELSGGQQQRVALARALVLEPRLLLLDEPLSALDLRTRRTIRGELRRLLAEQPCTTLYVTHSPAEALAFGASITVLEAGRISQSGSREDLMKHPRSPYVAEFLGVNFFRGTVDRGRGGGGVRVVLPEGDLVIGDPQGEGDVSIVVHPRDITLTLEAPVGTARNVFPGAIEEIVPEPPAGDLVRVALNSTPRLIAEVTREAVRALGLREGMRVFASFKASGVTVVE